MIIYKNLTEELYQKQLNKKVIELKKLFNIDDIKIYSSIYKNFRNRVEFRVWHQDNNLYYAMFNRNREIFFIDKFEIVSSHIDKIMWKLIKEIAQESILKQKIFAIEFLSSLKGDIIVTLIYHRKLDEVWEEKAKILEKNLNISIIGRSRKQKLTLSKDFIEESFKVDDRILNYRFYDGSFIQPNGYINQKMINWVISNLKSGGDLLELYCGAGNFTIPMSFKFRKVLATEISKISIKSAKESIKLNSIKNIEFLRMSAEELNSAFAKEREFNRLKDIDLESFNFSTLFLDPPRSGVDKATLKLSKRFQQVIYISCNPITLKENLESLLKDFKIVKFALFDQFPYTDHIEVGVVLNQK